MKNSRAGPSENSENPGRSARTVDPGTKKEAQTRRLLQKTVLFVGDKVFGQLRKRVLAKLPRNSSVSFRSTSKTKAEQIFPDVEKFLSDHTQPTHIVSVNSVKLEATGTMPANVAKSDQ
jgi:hypothetical protein